MTIQETTIPYKERETLRIKVSRAENSRFGLILAHGAGAGMDSPFMLYFLRRLSELDVSVLQFNFRYKEAGRKAPHPRPRLESDYRVIIEYAETDVFKNLPFFAGGKSMGGRIVTYIAADYPAIRGLAFLGYPLHAPGRPGTERAQHLYDLAKPMLFISGSRDKLASTDLLEAAVGKIGARARLVLLDGADHSLQLPKRAELTTEDMWDRSCREMTEWFAEVVG